MRGIPNERHESSVQLRKKSEITQIGGCPSAIMSLRTRSNGCFIFLMASIKVLNRAIEGRSAVFSHPSGSSGTVGNGMIDKEILGCLEVSETMNGAFDGVVMMTTFRPQIAKAFEMSSNGMVWP